MVKTGRVKRDIKVNIMRSGTLGMGNKGVCSWVLDSQAVCTRGRTLGTTVLADQKVLQSPPVEYTQTTMVLL